jgi:16S rRNA (guanine(1405)-N(7))-methyltransferase
MLNDKQQNDELDTLVNAVLSSSKYQHISPDLVRAIAAQESEKRRHPKEVIKHTKNKLHQVSGAYGLDKPEHYAQWRNHLATAVATNERAELKHVCRTIMQNHTSTRERLPILDAFYATVLSELPPIKSVLDIACGLNPLTMPWMPLAPDARYHACDIHQPMLAFLNDYMQIIGVKGEVSACNVLQHCPTTTVDVALVLKAIPCLEQIDKQASKQLLQTIQARYIVVSFPIHSLGGKNKGMTQYYTAHFGDVIGEQGWGVEKYEFATELAFVVKK